MVMAVGPALVSKMGNSPAALEKGASFKQIMANKQELSPLKVDVPLAEPKITSLGHIFKEAVSNHEKAAKAIKTSMVRTDYRPENLLSFQYETGISLLRLQMFCKTAEQLGNALKNFTQLQV